MSQKVCLILTCFNRPAYLKQCLESLAKADLSKVDKFIIVDDASADEGVFDILRFLKITYIVSGASAKRFHGILRLAVECKFEIITKLENKGIKDSLLQGCEMAFEDCDIVISLDADSIVKPDFINRLLDLKQRFPDKIISGFNCNKIHNRIMGYGDDWVSRPNLNGINLCFNKGDYEKIIRPALLSQGDWDHKIGTGIITKPSVVQHIGKESAMGHPMFDQACDFEETPEMTISIIHPSRSRPEQAAATIEKWLGKAKDRNRIEYLLSIDIDDTEANKIAYLENTDKSVNVFQNKNKSAIEAINYAAIFSCGDLLIVVSDDFDCPHHWDELLINSLKGQEDFVVKTDDGTQPWIITLPIMDRKYYNRFGYIYNPKYSHMFCDTEMSHVADLLNRKIKLPITFKHNHYSTGKVERDALNERNDNTWEQGKKVYLEGIKNNFGLPESEIRGKLNCSPDHIAWLANEGVEASVKPLLTILIPTVNGREKEFNRLVDSLLIQIKGNPDVELLFARDNKEISIGAKRQGMLAYAHGEYVVFCDDDDSLAPDYIETILPILREKKPDCVGYLEEVRTGDEIKIAIHSSRFSEWGEGVAGYDYYRTIFYKNPIKTDIVRQIGFVDTRYSEDHLFAQDLHKSGLIQDEYFIDRCMYIYNAPNGSETFNERYGVKEPASSNK